MTANNSAVPPKELLARIELLRRSGRTIESVVDGSSMEPAIPRGARIRIQPQRELPAIGTTVAIVAPGGAVAHRLAERGRLPWNRRFVLTQGDGSAVCDPPLSVDLILGPVTGWSIDGEYRAVPARDRSARAAGWHATAWRAVVRLAFWLHPLVATALVRISLRGRVEHVQWRA